MKSDQNTKGILYILTGMAFFSIQDSLIKFIYNDIALFELYLGRTLIQACLLLLFVFVAKKKIVLKTSYPFLTLLRVVCFFFGFSFSIEMRKYSMTQNAFCQCIDWLKLSADLNTVQYIWQEFTLLLMPRG